jgi:hypothetical protein
MHGGNMSGEESNDEHRSSNAKRGDLVICLDTGSVGVVLEERSDYWIISFPFGTYSFSDEDFDILKSGRG